jgi:homoserine dehydrogenase
MGQVRIGLLGVGTVGQAVARALIERQDVLSRAAGTTLVLQRAAVRDLARPRALPADRLTADPAAVANADDVELVIELLGGQEPARTLIATALERGRPVVTANKRVLAWHGPELAALAARKGVELRYEAAVGGGIPLIAPLTDDLAANRVLELRAIINGTCNYVLTRMNSGEAFDAALAQAQQAGYAEADPRDDIDAVDAATSCVLVRPRSTSRTPAQIHRQGIRGMDARPRTAVASTC